MAGLSGQFRLEMVVTKNWRGWSIRSGIRNTSVLQPKIKFTDLKGLKPQLTNELGIKSIEDQRNISYNGKVLQFVICDLLSSQSFKEKKAEDVRVLYVIHNDELVLETLVRHGVKEGRREYFFPGFFDETLPRFKNGSWLTAVPKLVEFIRSKQHQI